MGVRRYRIQNARRFKRLRADYLMKVMDPKGEEMPWVTNIRDISAGGVRFLNGRNLSVGDNLQLSIPLPPLGEVLEARAQVIRLSRSRRHPVTYAAARFLEVPKRTQRMLAGFIEEIWQDAAASDLVDHQELVYREPVKVAVS